MNARWKDLVWLEGIPLEFKGGIDSDSLITPPDGRVQIIRVYENTLLLEMEFVESKWGIKDMKPRKLRWLVPKAAVFQGDVRLNCNGYQLRGDQIREQIGT